MNLSSYLQMPPAPLVSTNTSNAVPQGPRPGVGTSAGDSLGFDFADVMARQLQRLVPQERQTIAADTPPEAQTVTDKQDSRPAVQDRRGADRTDQKAHSTRTDNDDSDKDNADHASTQARPRKQGNTHTAERTDVDALLEGLMQGAPITQTPVTAEVTTTATTAAAVSAAVISPQTSANAELTTDVESLQTVALSPQMRIITDPKSAPSPESLAAFAKSMGLDESVIQDLLAQQPVTPATVLAGVTNTGVSTDGSALVSPNTLQAAMNTVLNGAAQGMVPTDSAVATAQQPVVVSGAGLAAPATTLATPAVPGLTPTDMAAIQQLQITVLPAAVLPVNTPATTNAPVPSTLDMLSLLGTGVDEQDVSALLSRFSEDAGSDSNPDQHHASHGESNNFSSFAQALSRSNNAAQAAANSAPTAANMSEVYDQLSDKMATEMAARMHKQLSDGEWKMKFALRPSNLGGVEIQLEMKDGKLDAVFRADNPLTRDLLQNSSQRLREALGNFGINAGQVNVGQGGGNTQQNNSGNSNRNTQVSDNSTSQVNSTGGASGTSSARSKANASLLDLYA